MCLSKINRANFLQHQFIFPKSTELIFFSVRFVFPKSTKMIFFSVGFVFRKPKAPRAREAAPRRRSPGRVSLTTEVEVSVYVRVSATRPHKLLSSILHQQFGDSEQLSFRFPRRNRDLAPIPHSFLTGPVPALFRSLYFCRFVKFHAKRIPRALRPFDFI